MKNLASLAALLVGCAVAFWLFALAFTTKSGDFPQRALLPGLIVAVASFQLAIPRASSAALVCLAMAAPTLLWTTLFFLQVLAEGKGLEWAHPLTALGVLAAAGLGTLVAHAIKGRFPKSSQN